MSQEYSLLAILNDGRSHPKAELAAQLGDASQAAVGALVQRLLAQGIDIRAVDGGGGYRLAEPLELLDESLIDAALDDAARPFVSRLEVHRQLGSTNTYLMGRAKAGLGSGAVCFAEWQAAGRGRLGRSWQSPFGAQLAVSLLWRFNADPGALSSLSLTAGAAVARALESLGVPQVGLKWPNDLLWRRRKLAGILPELGVDPAGGCYVVTGLGLNVALPVSVASAIDQPWIDLRGILGSGRIPRNRLAARIVSELVTTFRLYERCGFEAFRREWDRFDCVAGQRVTLKRPNGSVTGIARGVDGTGALLLETTGDQVKAFMAGEISLRFEA